MTIPRTTVCAATPEPSRLTQWVRSVLRLNPFHMGSSVTRPPASTARRRPVCVATAGDALERRQLLSATGGPVAEISLLSVTPNPGEAGEVRSIDGTGNNLADPTLGAAHTTLRRLAAADYGDGVSTLAGADRQSARVISNLVADQDGEQLNTLGRTDFLWLWGQFIDHDIDLTEPAEPAESAPIDVPVGDAHFDPTSTGAVTINLDRSIYDESTGVREQINEITAYIDGSMVYGSDQERADALRTWEGGRLKVTEMPTGDLLPLNVDELPNAGGTRPDMFVAGDVRANENIYLTAMHTLWVREHNRLADEIAASDPTLGDEAIYQQARELVVAQIQQITYDEWLPALVGVNALSRYEGYDAAVDPTVANEFSTAAFRFGHSLLPSSLTAVGPDGEPITLELRNAFFRPDQVFAIGVDGLLEGASLGLASELDELVVDDLRNFLFGQPGAGGFDLISLNIQRGRDHGLSSYNDTREALGLSRATGFADLTDDLAVQDRLASAYQSVDQIDLFVGGLAEDPVRGSMLGETFHRIVVDQFTRLRDGDRFFYSGEADLAGAIAGTRLSDVISRNTTAELSGNVFIDRDAADPRREETVLHRRGEPSRVRLNEDERLRVDPLGPGRPRPGRSFEGDFDGDGRLDTAIVAGDGRVEVLFAQAGPVRRRGPSGSGRIAPGSTVVVGDFDGDGRDDLSSLDRTSGRWSVQTFDHRRPETTVWTRWGVGVNWDDITVGDFDGDDRDDIAARNESSGEWFVARSTGDGFDNERWGRWSAGIAWESVQAADLDGDGRSDLIGRNPHGGMVYAAMSDGRSFANRAYARLSSAYRWDDLIVGDFDGDGADEIGARLTATGAWYCLSMEQRASPMTSRIDAQAFGRWTAGIDWSTRRVADFDGDGDDDILTVRDDTGEVFLAMGDAAGFVNRAIGRL